MIIRMTKSQNLVTLALILYLILCIQLILRGYNDFSEKQHVDFPTHFFRLRVGAEYVGLNIIYLIWLIQNKEKASNFSFTNILKSSFLFLIIAFLGYPITSDIYLYLQYGLMDLNGINPFINTAEKFSSELSTLLGWQSSSTYGPVSQLFFMTAAYFIPISLILGVYVFKIFCLLMHGINGYLIWRQLKLSPHQRKITLAYLVNPVLLFEQVTNAHVDVFISTVLIVLIACLKNFHYLAGILTIWIGFLAKTLPIIWLPLVSVFLIRQQRWKSLLVASFLSLAIVVGLYCSVLPTFEAWKSLLNPGVKELTVGSLHNMLRIALDKLPNLETHFKTTILSAFKLSTYFCFAFYYTWILFKPYFRRGYSEANLSLSIGWITLALFLFATPWYQPWYTSILLPITALNINSRHFVLTSLTFCLSSNCSYYLIGYGSSPGSTFFGLIGSLLAVGPAIVTLILGRKLLQAWAGEGRT